MEGRFGAPPGDQLGPPSTVSATQRQSHKMGSAACEACRSTAPMPLRQHGCTPGHTRWQWNPVRYARSRVSHSHSCLGWRRCRWRWRLLNPRGYTANYSKMYAQPYVAPICRQLTGVAPQLTLLSPRIIPLLLSSRRRPLLALPLVVGEEGEEGDTKHTQRSETKAH